jgi:hypothetical protein
MKKQLEVGKNYYDIFGSDTTGKKQLIYNGGISWTAIDGNRKMTMDSQKQTNSALEYINRPSYGTGIRI